MKANLIITSFFFLFTFDTTFNPIRQRSHDYFCSRYQFAVYFNRLFDIFNPEEKELCSYLRKFVSDTRPQLQKQ